MNLCHKKRLLQKLNTYLNLKLTIIFPPPHFYSPVLGPGGRGNHRDKVHQTPSLINQDSYMYTDAIKRRHEI